MLNEILKVFTKEYREETKYREFLREMLPNLKLQSDNEDIDSKIEILRKKQEKV
jgi:hypothetical protein